MGEGWGRNGGEDEFCVLREKVGGAMEVRMKFVFRVVVDQLF